MGQFTTACKHKEILKLTYRWVLSTRPLRSEPSDCNYIESTVQGRQFLVFHTGIQQNTQNILDLVIGNL
jgi:hypothetical protein